MINNHQRLKMKWKGDFLIQICHRMKSEQLLDKEDFLA